MGLLWTLVNFWWNELPCEASRHLSPFHLKMLSKAALPSSSIEETAMLKSRIKAGTLCASHEDFLWGPGPSKGYQPRRCCSTSVNCSCCQIYMRRQRLHSNLRRHFITSHSGCSFMLTFFASSYLLEDLSADLLWRVYFPSPNTDGQSVNKSLWAKNAKHRIDCSSIFLQVSTSAEVIAFPNCDPKEYAEKIWRSLASNAIMTPLDDLLSHESLEKDVKPLYIQQTVDIACTWVSAGGVENPYTMLWVNAFKWDPWAWKTCCYY